MYNLLVLKNEANEIAGLSFFTVVGDSMSPQFDAGDLVIIKKVDIDAIDVDDIIAFNKDGLIVTHRVTEIANEVFFTQGDNNNLSDDFKITYSNIMGKYIFKIPNGDTILHIIKSPLFTIVIFILLLVNITLLAKFVQGNYIL